MPSRGWGQIAARLAAMDRGELLERVRQEFSKRADAALFRFGFDFRRGDTVSGTAKPGKFFFGPQSIGSILDALRQRLPEQVEQIRQQADKICHHRFDLLGYENLDYGDPIQWHLDAVHGKSAPRKPFHKIRFLDFDEVGDSKITWELNRHHHLVTLAKAYRLTQDERYVREIAQQWKQWHAENPYPIGINWASSLEVAFRSLSWMWMFFILEDSPALSQEFRREWLQAQELSGRHIERYLSTYFSPNTHLLGEGVALFFLGVLCPELSPAKRWRSMGWEIVLRESKRQVDDDGFHFEGSTYYHVYATDFFLHSLLLAAANEVAIPSDFDEKVQKMLHALSLLGRAGPPPRFGDDDGGRLFDARRNRNQHLLDPLATGAVLFHRPDLKALAGGLREDGMREDGLREETIWLLGAAGVDEFDRLESREPALESASLPQAGLYLAAAEPRTQLVIYAGRQGERGTGHMHADALSLCLQSAGQCLLMDPGTCEYVGESGARDLFRSTRMHNTLRVAEASQSEPSGPFSWRRRARSTVEQWIQGETLTLFCGSHDGYTQQSPPVVHRRWVVGLNSGLFLVRDVAEGQGETKLNISWHLGPEMRAGGETLLKREGSSQALVILPAQGHGWTQETLEDRWCPAYGIDKPGTTLTFSTQTRLPAEFVTLLLPINVTALALGVLTLVTPDTAADVRAYSYKHQGDEHLFFFAQSKPWRYLSVESDADFVYWRRNETEDKVVVLCNGSYVAIHGQRILSTRRRVSLCELVVGNSGCEVFCSTPEDLEERSTRPVSGGTATARDRQAVSGDPEA
ncbi:MAG TPA: alginate lyase family protein [Candidatus Sulfotelmatobacter sp.]